MVRRFPRLSVSKLAEYIVATPRRQRRILLDSLGPRDYVVNHHRRARSAILWASRRGGVDEDSLTRSIDRLRTLEPRNERDAREIRNSVAAIESFMRLKDELNLPGMVRRPRTRSETMLLEGVVVSVKPSFIVLRGETDTPSVGAIKLYLVKTNPLTKRAGEYATTILRRFLESRLGDDSSFQVDPELCQVADVFAGRVHVAPRAYKQRMDDVRAACDAIRRLWPTYLMDIAHPPYEDQPYQAH